MRELIPARRMVGSCSASSPASQSLNANSFETEFVSGLAAAKAKGKRVGRPRVAVDVRRIASLRRQGRSWAEITRETGISKGTAQRAQASSLPKTPVAGTSPSA